MSTPKIRAAVQCALLATTALSAPALAQTGPIFRQLDQNYVDISRGSLELTFEDGAIGSGQARLALTRVRDGTATNATILQWDRIIFRKFTSGAVGSPATYHVILADGFTDIFSGGAFDTSLTSTKGTGATLIQSNGVATYRTADGTEIEFTDPTGGESMTYCQWAWGQVECELPLASITRPNGGKTNFSWYVIETGISPSGVPYHDQRFEAISNSFGYRIAFDYSGTVFHQRTGARFYNDAISTTTPQRTIGYAYPSAGVVNITDFAGQVWQVTASSIKRPGESTPSFSANSVFGVTSVTRDGVTTSYNRTVSGTAVTMTVTDALGEDTVIKSSTATGVASEITNAAGKKTSFAYDAYQRLTRVTQPEGNYVQYTYDTRGNVTETRRVRKPGSSSTEVDIVTKADFSTTCANPKTCNQPNWTRDANGNQTDYTYDPTHGGVLTVTAPADSNGVRPQTRYGYTLTNGEYLPTSIAACQTLASCTGGADEVKTTVSYNSNGLPTTVAQGSTSLTATTTNTFDSMGDLLTVNGPLSGTADTTTYRYDAMRRRTGVISPDPDGTGVRKRRAQRNTYDIAGRLTKVEAGTVTGTTDTAWAAFSSAEQLTTTYSNNRKVVDVLTAGGTTYGVTHYSYYPTGQLQCTAQRMNSAAWNSPPTNACTLQTASTTFGPDRITRNEYDEVGRIEKVTTGYGTTAAADDATYSYTDNGNVETIVDGKGNKTTYTYNGQDRHSRIFYPSPTTAGTSSTTDYDQRFYDQNGNVTQFNLRGFAVNSVMKILFTYDKLNRMTLKDVRTGENDTAYEYDLLGRTTQVSRAADGTMHQMSYDALGRLTQETQPFGSASYRYDLAGRRTRLTWNDGFYVTYDNDVTGNVTAIRENGATSGAGVLATYAYDDLGRRTGITRGNGTGTTYGYDNVSRLNSLVQNLSGTTNDLTLGFSYNPASQITQSTRSNDLYAWGGHYNRDWTETANGLNQLTGQSGTPSSGAAGTLGYDNRANVTSMGTRTFTYSSENHLKSASGGVSLYYDGLDRLVEYDTSVSTRFAYDGVDMIAEVANPSGAITRRYVHGPGSDEPLVWYEGAGTTDRRWLHADERGSIVAVSNGTGAMTDINSYDEYGVPAASNAGRFGYTGQAWLPGLDMYYYKARIYASMIGRFMQPDPIGYEGGMNLYTYVGGDPVNGIDTLGLKLDRPCVWSNGCFTIGGHFVPSSGQSAGPTSAGETEVISQWRWVPDSTFTINLNSGSWFNFDFEFPTPEKSEDDTYYLTEANCWRSGLLLRATGNALVDIGGVGTAIGGTGVAVGTGLGIFGAVTGNVPAAGFGAIVTGTAAPIATAGVATQFVGSVTAFIGGESSKTLIRNASGAVINRIPFAPSWVKSGLKEGAKRISDYVPEVRICHANRY